MPNKPFSYILSKLTGREVRVYFDPFIGYYKDKTTGILRFGSWKVYWRPNDYKPKASAKVQA